MKEIKIIAGILIAAIVIISECLGQANVPPDMIEGIYSFRYNIFKYDQIVYLRGDTLYVPLKGILTHFKVNNRITDRMEAVKGFYITPDTTYEINFKEKKIRVKDRVAYIQDDEYFRTDVEYYVTLSFLRKAFGWQFDVFHQNLICYMTTVTDLPLLSELKRRKQYKHLGKGNDESSFLPLLFPRKRSWLNGGMTDYTISAYQFPGARAYNYSANVGLELLGGDVQVMNYGAFNEKGNSSYNYSYRYRYFFSDNNYLSQINLGYITNSSYRTSMVASEQIKGVQISNEQMQMPALFTTYEIADRTEPGWQVEMYVNGQLADQVIADPNGDFRFNLPIYYGYTNVDLKFYGLEGEYVKKQRVFSVPSEFLRPGEIRYSLSGGESVLSKRLMADGRVSIGITSWLSTTAGVEKNVKSNDKLSYSNHTIFKLTNRMLFAFDGYSDRLLAGSGRFSFGNWGSYSLGYIRYLNYDTKSDYYLKDRINASAGLSRIFGLPLNIVTYGSLTNYSQSKILNFNSNIFITMSPFMFTARYNYSGLLGDKLQATSSSINTGLSWSWFKKSRAFSFMRNTRLSGNCSYDFMTKKVTAYSLNINQPLFRIMSLQIGGSYNPESKYLGLNANLMINLPSLKSSSTAIYSNSSSSYTQKFDGTLGFDSHNLDFHFSNPIMQSTVGSGAAAFRFFMDSNNNGVFDEGEEEIRDVKVEVPMGTMDRTKNKYSDIAYNLAPYTRVNAVIDKDSFKNPLWVPRLEGFSFISQPNVYQSIDVPCFTAGIIEGAVLKNMGSYKYGQQGVIVHIMNQDSSYREEIQVFSDGTFYKMGIPPGDYIAWVDTDQTAILQATPDKEKIEFKITQNPNGDVISGLNFQLLTKEYYAYQESKPGTVSGTGDAANIHPAGMPSAGTPSSLPSTGDNTAASLPEDQGTTQPAPAAASQTPAINPAKMKVIYFAGNRSVSLSDEDKAYLDALVKYLKGNSGASLAIVGHTDNFGTSRENLDVSARRAQAVADYLASKGIARTKLLSKGQGALYPASQRQDEEGRKLNRRVEISIIK